MALEYGYTRWAMPAAMLPGIMIGAVGALQISGSVMQARWQDRLRSAAGLPIAGALGFGTALALPNHGWQMATFVVMTFLTIAARRFGPLFTIWGLVTWVAYFMVVLLAPPRHYWLELIGAEVIAAVGVFVLSLLIWRHRPGASLDHARSTWNELTRETLNLAAQAWEHPSPRRRRRLVARARLLADTALIVEGWLAEVSTGQLAPRLRLLQAQFALEEIVACSVAHEGGSHQDLAALLTLLAAGADPAAKRVLADHLAHGGSRPEPQARMLEAASELLDARSTSHEPGEFTPAVKLVPGGGLPGIAGVPGVGAHRVRLGLATRQAIQASVAIAVVIPIAHALTRPHDTWALIAVFVVFLGPITRGEVLLKAGNRALGTIAGLLVAAPLTLVTQHHPERVIVIALFSCFAGYYLMTISYAYLIFFITITVLQFYDVLGQFTPALLELRLLATVLGAAAAAAAAFLILPIQTRDTCEHIVRTVVEEVADLLGAVADQLDEGGRIVVAEISPALRVIDTFGRHHRLAGEPLRWTRHGAAHRRAEAQMTALVRHLRRLSSDHRLEAAYAEPLRGIAHEIRGAGHGGLDAAVERLGNLAHTGRFSSVGLDADE